MFGAVSITEFSAGSSRRRERPLTYRRLTVASLLVVCVCSLTLLFGCAPHIDQLVLPDKSDTTGQADQPIAEVVDNKGTEGELCRPDLSCNPGLVCVVGRCQNPNAADAAHDLTDSVGSDVSDLSADAISADAPSDAPADALADVADDSQDTVDIQLGETIQGEQCKQASDCESGACKVIFGFTKMVCSVDALTCVYSELDELKYSKTGVCTGEKTIQICSEGTWTDDVACPFQQPICVTDRCTWCVPDQLFCSQPDTVAQCSPDGLGITSTFKCPTACNLSQPGNSLSDKCHASCKPASKAGCSGDSYWECNGGGTEWVLTPCPAQQICVGEGFCVAEPFTVLYTDTRITAFGRPRVTALTSGEQTLLFVGFRTEGQNEGTVQGDLSDIRSVVWNPGAKTISPFSFLSAPQNGEQSEFELDGQTGLTGKSAFATWSDRLGTSASNLSGRWHDHTGKIVGGVLTFANSSHFQYSSDAAVFGENKVAVVWSEFKSGDTDAIKAMILDTTANPILTTVDQKQPLGLALRRPMIAPVGQNRFTIAWRDADAFNVQCLTSDGALVLADGPINWSVTSAAGPAVAGRHGGTSVVLWSQSDGLRFALVDGSCKKGTELTVTGNHQADKFAVAIWGGGNFVVVYAAVDEQNPTKDGIFAQIYSSSGTLLQGPIRVSQPRADRGELDVAAYGENSFVVVWKSERKILGRLFSAP